MHGCLLGTRVRALDSIVDHRLDLGMAQLVQVGQDLRGGMAVALARVAQAVDEDGEELVGLRRDDGRLLLELQALEEMAERREARGDEGGRRGGADGKADALEDGSLAGLGDAIVLDAGLEIGKQLQARVDGRRRLLQRRKEGRDLVLHGGMCYCEGAGHMGQVCCWCVVV